jgi:hypothetical protein
MASIATKKATSAFGSDAYLHQKREIYILAIVAQKNP